MRIGPHMKAVTGAVVALVAFLVSIQDVMPENVRNMVAAIVAVLTPISIWLTSNGKAVEEAAVAVEDTVGAFQKRDA